MRNWHTNVVSYSTASLPGNNFEITVGSALVTKDFELTMDNVLANQVDNVIYQINKKSSETSIPDEVVKFKKLESTITPGLFEWRFEDGSTHDWIQVQPPTEVLAANTDYKDLRFAHTITVDYNSTEVKIEILDA